MGVKRGLDSEPAKLRHQTFSVCNNRLLKGRRSHPRIQKNLESYKAGSSIKLLHRLKGPQGGLQATKKTISPEKE